MKKILAGLAAIALCLSLAGCPWYPQDNGYELVYEDNFDTPSSTWQTTPYNLEPPVVEDGTMTLRSYSDTQRAAVVGTFGPRGASEPNYPADLAWEEGYFEARLRYTDTAWAWPVFWLFSAHKMESWPGEDCSRLTSEIDFLEPGLDNRNGDKPANRYYFGNLHENTADSSADGMWCGQSDDIESITKDFGDVNISDWHVWGGRWTADEVCTYMDSELIGCKPTFDSMAQPMNLLFMVDYQNICGSCGPKPAEIEVEVDWVKVWQK